MVVFAFLHLKQDFKQLNALQNFLGSVFRPFTCAPIKKIPLGCTMLLSFLLLEWLGQHLKTLFAQLLEGQSKTDKHNNTVFFFLIEKKNPIKYLIINLRIPAHSGRGGVGPAKLGLLNIWYSFRLAAVLIFSNIWLLQAFSF